MAKFTAVYTRVSTCRQSTRSQEADLQRWIAAQDENQLGQVQWFTDSATGKNMDRVGWQKLQSAIDAGQVSKLVVWRLDRLGRTAAGLCKLFDDLNSKNVRLVSLRDAVDLATPSGRLVANVLASVAAFETEVRGERVKAGQAAAKAAGKTWGGSEKGRLVGITHEQAATIVRLHTEGTKPSQIARSTGVHRSTVHRVLRRVKEGCITVE